MPHGVERWIKGGATILDVRTPMEYLNGHVAGSLNIPLRDLPSRLDEVREMVQPVIVCCASGVRSEQAAQILQHSGIACENGGSWMEVDYYKK